jgi:L-serine dehydratase
MISVGETFKIGIGPSSSHTMGPLAITRQFIAKLRQNPPLKLKRLRIELRGSLALTGRGHGTLEAIQLGLLGFNEEYDEIDDWRGRLTALQTDHLLQLGQRAHKVRPGPRYYSQHTGRARLAQQYDIAVDPE